jgi:ATP-dependent helicase/nuclease subunit A
MRSDQPRFDFEALDLLESRDAHARTIAIDPTRNVALEASAGTGKTRVLVDRYIGLLLSGVKPRNILAITFTRKAAAEMRQRILDELGRRHREGSLGTDLWREIRESITDIAISTIDAFCLTLLREFPLEAGVDPGFELADETETPRLIGEALDKTLRIGRALTTGSEDIALLFAELGEFRLREGLSRLIDRRLVADDALNRFLRGRGEASVEAAVARLVARLRAAFASVPGGLEGFEATGPRHPDFDLLSRDLRQLLGEPPPSPPLVQAYLERVRTHLLTQTGEPRKRLGYKKDEFRTGAEYGRHAAAVAALGPYLVDALTGYRREINVVLARAVRQLFSIALQQYELVLRKHGVLDFSDVLKRTLQLLSQMEEFSRSRYRLESRYQHVLVDEFQDTSRAQWALVELLVRSWSEGMGLTDSSRPPTVFIVGDRKQSIYGFRDADVAVLDEAAQYIEALRPGGQVRTAITRSFRAVRELLAFVNDVFSEVDKAPERTDAFRYTDDDRFPVASVDVTEPEPLGVVAAPTDDAQAEAVAEEVARLLASGATVRDRETGVRRAARPGDVAILFRTREGHRVFEEALARRRVPFYVYKGLGFFDADEIKDVLALLAYLSNPASELRTAAFLRSRFVRLSDAALKLLAPDLSASLTSPDPPPAFLVLEDYDAERLRLARADVPRWLRAVDRLAPADVVDAVLAESAYAAEMRGPEYRQARENLKKVRSLIRRMQNRGYATLGRIFDHLSQMATGGDESNAIVDAMDAVNMMTVHAAKGLEFPVVFVANLHRGSGGSGEPIRVVTQGTEDGNASVAIGDYQNEADKDLEAKETEEAKRLLYVALTRARDRLYLGATLNAEGRLAAPKGSMGRVLPAPVCDLLSRAGVIDPGELLEWRGSSATHRLTVSKATGLVQEVSLGADDSRERTDAFGQLSPESAPRLVAATRVLIASDSLTVTDACGRLPRTIALDVGVLVHRALQADVAMEADSLEDRRRAVVLCLKPDERVLVDDVDKLVDEAVQALEQIDRSSLRQCLHEVPFSLRRDDGTFVRGAIDAIVEHANGRVEILEFKTGSPRAEHEQQLAVYVEAARALYPNSQVSGRLIYTSAV